MKNQIKDIPTEMKAVVCYGPGDYRFETVPVPEVNKNEVLIKVLACGICASDLKAYKGAPVLWGKPGGESWIKVPVIAGHEFVGKVVKLGLGAAEKYELQLGDKVVSEQIIPCGSCSYCQSGHYWMCDNTIIYGFQGKVAEGGMAEYAKFPSKALVYKVPEVISDEAGAMIEPLACATHAVMRGKIELGEIVVISGAGALGLSMLQVAKMKNPGLLIIADLKEERLALARELGADATINPSLVNPVEALLETTGGKYCDVYIEATGFPQSVVQGLNMIKKLGKFVEFGLFAEETTANWSTIGDRKEIDIYGSHLSPYTYPLAIDFLASGKVVVDKIVTHSYPLKEFKKAFETASNVKEAIKVIVKP